MTLFLELVYVCVCDNLTIWIIDYSLVNLPATTNAAKICQDRSSENLALSAASLEKNTAEL